MSRTQLYKHLIKVNLFNINDKRKTKKNVKNKKQKSRT